MINPLRQNSAHGGVFIGLGSNQGERARWLAMALAKLRSHEAVFEVRESSLYETEPLGFLAQPAFINQVVEIFTNLTPQRLLERLLQIENELGRVRTQRWGPRNIDLDLLAYQNYEIVSENLQLPHPEIPKRRFVLEPWCEIAPHFRVPKWRRTVAELFERCDDHSTVNKVQALVRI